MPKSFNSPKEFSTFLSSSKFNKSSEDKSINEGLKVISRFLELKAKEKFGHYQKGWKELENATKIDRVKKGFSENEPLLRTGDLRDSVTHRIERNTAFVGSTSEIMLYQEKGTDKTGWGKGIPPRPVFLITMLNNGAEGVKLFAKTFIENMRL